MGLVKNVGFDIFPKQGKYLGRKVEVSFDNSTNSLIGKMVRDDMEDPFKTIIELGDGRYILGSECIYRPLDLSYF